MNSLFRKKSEIVENNDPISTCQWIRILLHYTISLFHHFSRTINNSAVLRRLIVFEFEIRNSWLEKIDPPDSKWKWMVLISYPVCYDSEKWLSKFMQKVRWTRKVKVPKNIPELKYSNSCELWLCQAAAVINILIYYTKYINSMENTIFYFG